MTVNEVLDYNKLIKLIIDEDKDITALAKFKLLGMCKQFESTVRNFDTVRDECIMKYGTDDGNGNKKVVIPNDESDQSVKDAYNNLVNDLNVVLDSDANIEITKLKYEDVMNAGLPSDYLIALYDLIEE
jgi:hypothetical protein